jgi:hypothetical protein
MSLRMTDPGPELKKTSTPRPRYGAAGSGAPQGPPSAPAARGAVQPDRVLRPSLGTPSVEGISAEKFKEYKYVPLECPNCGFSGKVKITLLDRSFHCKECNQVFHVTVDGTVRGTRPAEPGVTDPGAPLPLEKPNWVEKKFSQLPPAARWSPLAGALVILVWLGFSYYSSYSSHRALSKDLQKRAELAGRALALGDLRTLDRMTMSDEVETLHTWYEKVRPNEFADLPPESDLTVTVGELGKLLRRAERVAGKNKKVVVADFRTPLEIALPPDDDDMQLVAQVDLVWVKEDGEWRIDADWLRDSEQRIHFGPPRPFVPPVPAGEAAEGQMAPNNGPVRALSRREKQKLRESGAEQAPPPQQAEEEETEEEAPEEQAPAPAPPPRRRRGN